MNKKQFIEKSLTDFRHDFGEGYPSYNNPDKESWTREKVKMIEHFLQSKLSECWDMAGEEKFSKLMNAVKKYQYSHPNSKERNLYWNELWYLYHELEALTSQKEGKDK